MSNSSTRHQQPSHLGRLLMGAVDSNSETKWNLVLKYLQSHTLRDRDAPLPPFDSPIQDHSYPTVELEDQLLNSKRTGSTPLLVAVPSAPSNIVAALCHLGPEATGIPDGRNRLPLHWACMRSSDDAETNTILEILVQCNPEGLIRRDDQGRTPLHWLLWHSASSRQVSLIKFMCQNHPKGDIRSLKQPAGSDLPTIPNPSRSKEIPPSAVIIPDSNHGALPLHYAVMNGASREVLKTLISIYPGSLACKDRQGRTPLAWYLGAGSLMDHSKTVCGEPMDPSDDPWWKQRLSTTVIQMLLSSKVSRTFDSNGRTPLHWASHFYALGAAKGSETSFLSIATFRMLLDNYIEALTIQDGQGQTPLHVLFDVTFQEKQRAYHRQEANRKHNDLIDLKMGGPVLFAPPLELIQMLVRSTDDDDDPTNSACYLDDNAGCLPIHTALRACTSPEIIQLLIRNNPTGLIRRSDDRAQTPLVQAFASPFSAPSQPVAILQLLMGAYATSRHGAFVDGRLGLKMDDEIGNYPIHYAVRNDASLETIRKFVHVFPRVALLQNAEGDMPIHCMLSKENLFEPPKTGIIRGASLVESSSLSTEKEIAWQKQVKEVQLEKMRILLKPLYQLEHLKIASLAHGMTPLHIAVGFGVLDYNELYQMLDTYPEAASLQTKTKGHEVYCIDLHAARRNDCEDDDAWQFAQELLFSFHPLLENHRHREDLLASCVRLIRDEITGEGSYHLEQMLHRKVNGLTHVDISETLSAIEAPDVDMGTCKSSKRKKSNPQGSNSANGFLNNLSLSGSLSFGKTEKKKPKVVTSIYDADIDGGYVVSPQSSVYEDDDSFLSPKGAPIEIDDAGFDILSSTKYSKSKTEKETAKEQPHEESPQEVENKEIPFLSEVALRLWSFFVLFRDKKNPDDNYSTHVEQILDGLDFELIERMITLPVPDYALRYLDESTVTEGITLHDVASPCCMAFFHSIYYFLGRYEFPKDAGRVLMHRSSDGKTVWIKAVEHHASTAEYHPGNELAPGTAEEAIWQTGEVVPEEEGYLAPKFHDSKTDVYFKLTKSRIAYETEVECRKEIENYANSDFIFPVIGQYDALGESKVDQRYNADTHDDRFEVLHLPEGGSLRLSDYPHAFVYPYRQDENLFDHFYHCGIEGMEEIVDIASQLGIALKSIHESGVVVGSLSMQNVARMEASTDSPKPKKIWTVSDLSNSCVLKKASSFLGAISHDGSLQCCTGLMPPEMFVKLTAAEMRIYRNYWDTVELRHNVIVDKTVLKPFMNVDNGHTYVFRCCFVPKGGESASMLPDLPYQLISARESTDLWCFGLLLFFLCSGGRQLFPQNIRTGHVLNMETIANWDRQALEANVYGHIEDPLAQDLLFMLLSSFEERNSLDMDKVLGHPFFNRIKGPMPHKLISRRMGESAAYNRRRQTVATKKLEDDWLQGRTMSVTSWDFDVLIKMHSSCSGIVERIAGKSTEALGMPCTFIMLPYLLSVKNKQAKLAPTSKIDVERAEQMGTLLLALAKACYFAVLAQDAIDKHQGEHWTASKLIESMTSLPSGDEFGHLKEQLIKIGAGNIEAFRTKPMSILYMLVGNCVCEVNAAFRQAGKAFFYLVDEYKGVPLTSAACAPYPIAVPEKDINSLLLKVLPFMHAVILSARTNSGGVPGLVRLIFEAAYPHIPASWAQASSGLPHTLDQKQFSKEVNILNDTLAFMSSSKSQEIADDLQNVREMCLKFDTLGDFANMQRVQFSDSGFWTTKEGAEEIQEMSKNYGFKEALKSKAALENKIKVQNRVILKLREQIERQSFQKALNLKVPENEQNQNVQKDSSGKFPEKEPSQNVLSQVQMNKW
eukprot:scaffold22715_cov128-Cylindrotheca_fusiformis.AAC.2